MNAKSYMNLGPVVPYLIRGANTLTAGDVDGDGRVEIASYCPTNNTLNILSYFEYGDASPSWATPAGAPANGQMINAWACMQTIPPNASLVNGWALQPGDQYFAAKLTGGAAFLVIFNPSTLNFGIVQLILIATENSQACKSLWHQFCLRASVGWTFVARRAGR